MARLLEKYRREVVPLLCQRFGKRNPLAVARLEKVVINMGISKGTDSEKRLEGAARDLALITGQKPIVTRARRSISGFKVRRGDKVGLKVTLRGRRMYEFLDRLICTAIPRIRDFRGLSPDSFDAMGNYSFGLSEQTVFPEIDIDKVEHIQGMDITITISGGSREESLVLLQALGMPFRRTSGPGAAAGGG